MHELIRTRVIKELMEELENVDAPDLEIIGHKVIETLESTKLVHHGINKDRKPVGHTVDTFSQDFTVVGEYSTEKGYFDDSSGAKKEKRYDKIQHDIDHAIKLSGGTLPSKIYLVTGVEEPPSFRKNFNVSPIPEDHRKRVVFLDSRQLAEVIYKATQENTLAADFYKTFLPDFSQNLDKYEYFGRAPTSCSNHREERVFSDALDAHFETGCAFHST